MTAKLNNPRRLNLARHHPPMIHVPAQPDESPKRAMAVECIKTGQGFYFGDRHYAIKGHQPNAHQLALDVMQAPGVCCAVPADLFIPLNPAHWPLFPLAHRLRFDPSMAMPSMNRQVAA